MTLQLGERTCQVLLLDTNFLTRLFDSPEARARRLLEEIDLRNTVFAVSLYTLVELRDRPYTYDKLIRLFAYLPFVIMKSFTQLAEEERKAYPDPTGIDPILVAPVGIRGRAGATQEETVREVLQNPDVVRLMEEFRSDRSSILNSILQLRKNFPKPRGGYKVDDVREFVSKVCWQQVVAADLRWVESKGGASFDLDPDAFPSMKSMIYSVFFRFYVDQMRKPKRSDTCDIASASALPYVDQAALEKNQAALIRNDILRFDPFLSELKLWTFRDLAAA